MDALKKDVVIPHGAPGGMSEYRCSLAASFLFKFFLCVSKELDMALPHSHVSAIEEYKRPPCRGVQYFAEGNVDDEAVGKPMKHLAADMQVGSNSCVKFAVILNVATTILIMVGIFVDGISLGITFPSAIQACIHELIPIMCLCVCLSVGPGYRCVNVIGSLSIVYIVR